MFLMCQNDIFYERPNENALAIENNPLYIDIIMLHVRIYMLPCFLIK